MSQPRQPLFPEMHPRRSEHGQSTIEFALSVGFVMLLLMAFLDMGRAIYAFGVVAEAAQEGARYAVISPNDTTGIVNTARSHAVGLNPSLLTVTRSLPNTSQVDVQVTYQFRPVTPMISQVIGGSGFIQLSNTARMLIER